jgi:hypothetical protein
VDVPGPFLVRWQPAAAGDYNVVIANYAPKGARRDDVEFAHLGWFADVKRPERSQ